MQLSPLCCERHLRVSHVFSCLFRQLYINQCKFHIISSSHSTCTACTTMYYRFFNVKWLKCTYVHLSLFHSNVSNIQHLPLVGAVFRDCTPIHSLSSVHTVRQRLRQRCRYQLDSTDVQQIIVLKCMVPLPLPHRMGSEPIYLRHQCEQVHYLIQWNPIDSGTVAAADAASCERIFKGVNRPSGSGSVKRSVRLDLIGSIAYRCCSPWRSKMDLGPIRSVKCSVTMHSNGTLPLSLPLLLPLLPLDATLDVAAATDADARCVHSLRVFLHSTGFVPVKLGNGSVGRLLSSAVSDKWFYSNFNWTFTWERALQTMTLMYGSIKSIASNMIWFGKCLQKWRRGSYVHIAVSYKMTSLRNKS